MKTFHHLPRGPLQTPDGYDAALALRDALARLEKSGLDAGIIGRTYLPTQKGDMIRIVLNDEITWSLKVGFWNFLTLGAENFVAVLCHEIGYALNQQHPDIKVNPKVKSVMVHDDNKLKQYQARYPTKYDFQQLSALT